MSWASKDFYEKLKLTEAEWGALLLHNSSTRDACEAQLAKALWMVRDWLDAYGIAYTADDMRDIMEAGLKEGGISKPDWEMPYGEAIIHPPARR